MAKAKKDLGLKASLSKKVPLGKMEKNMKETKEQVEIIHETEVVEEKVKIAKVYKRITLDVSPQMHRDIKTKCLDEGQSMREYLVRLINEDLGNI